MAKYADRSFLRTPFREESSLFSWFRLDIFMSKTHMAFVYKKQSVIADGHLDSGLHGISSQILHHHFRASKRPLAIDHPVLFKGLFSHRLRNFQLPSKLLHKLSLKTTLIARLGNRYLSLYFADFHLPCFMTTPPSTMQWR
jgi:hypothetical protein